MPAPPSSQLLNTAQSFGDLSRLLREGVADEESRQFRDALTSLSALIEDAAHLRRACADPSAIFWSLEHLKRAAREHQFFLTGLGSAWHALYELGAYQQALKDLRDAIDLWHQALTRHSRSEPACFDAFERLAWRTLGEALLVIDMYEQGGAAFSEPPAKPAGATRRPMLARLRRWLAGRTR
ncbi:hypothetical protein [Paracidovorax valerianellae]|uniref:Tetratricopeptide repeat-containing protein n=1 Tax=Paracidovorax valerianellae TaxID=187868 RepID=A0A1G6Q1D1_9BURK|nr:hypothetical protein [Paracidovorax valerianellae]MDA8444496.1 hypothetical protein [Paracidovorax valerianellae]SDC86250.1 hypothetical protein SAMN05192589_103404 [Paracidovorax valerianellae]